MSLENKSSDPSLQDCLNKIGKTLEIVIGDSKKYYMKAASEVSEVTLKEVDLSFAKLADIMVEFADCWFGSRCSGPDAVEISSNLDERIDMKLLGTKKLDFKHLKKIMTRLNRADDALLGLHRIAFYVSYYQRLCAEKGLKQLEDHANLFLEGTLNQAIDTVNTEIERYGNQIERCNLYYQNKMVTDAFRIAFISLLVATISVVISILPIVLPIMSTLLDPC